MTDHLEFVLPRTRESPGTARRHVAQWLRAQLGDAELQKAILLTSELVTNAVMHGQGEITLRAYQDEDRVLVEVIDQGHGFERVLRQENFDRVGGHGLSIVDAESSRSGSTRAPPTCGSSSNGPVRDWEARTSRSSSERVGRRPSARA